MDETTTTKTYVVIKPADSPAGEVYEVVGARSVTGKFGPQMALQAKGGKTLYVSGKSGIAKGLASGKLRPSMATPLRITASTAYGAKGPFQTWALAPRA
jgi:hypothetical protein